MKEEAGILARFIEGYRKFGKRAEITYNTLR